MTHPDENAEHDAPPMVFSHPESTGSEPSDPADDVQRTLEDPGSGGPDDDVVPDPFAPDAGDSAGS